MNVVRSSLTQALGLTLFAQTLTLRKIQKRHKTRTVLGRKNDSTQGL